MAQDIFTEPEDVDLETLRNLGPLAPLAGAWEGQGLDTHPVADGPEDERYRERIVFEPIDPQLNGPQLLYGLRYHVHVNKLDEVPTFHDQVGYWLWEPATRTLIQTLGIPRGLVAQAMGTSSADSQHFTVKAVLGSAQAGIVAAPFLHENFRTLEYTITITIEGRDAFRYEQTTLLQIPGFPEPFRHIDRNQLHRIAPAQRNPAAPTTGS
ncbi:MAG TPA: heme-binding beta-barrel domain-containing protein [Anaeromyxobacter sp.]|nr:heme-binding beta-barrel domain-containing protein [Anaeromyxobacter sp.]